MMTATSKLLTSIVLSRYALHLLLEVPFPMRLSHAPFWNAHPLRVVRCGISFYEPCVQPVFVIGSSSRWCRPPLLALGVLIGVILVRASSE
jgi:hypothetical protein